MENAIENHFNVWKIIIEIIIVFLILLIPIIFFYEKYNYEPLNNLLSSEAFWNLVELNISILTIISVIIIFKKDYYLGISIRDVMVLYDIPDVVLRVLVGSSFIFLLYGIYNVKKIRSSYISYVVEILVYIIMFYIILSVLVVVYKTADLLINSSKMCIRDRRYPDYQRKHFWKEHTFWTDGYFVFSVGNVSEEMLRKYIENQG